MERSKYLSQATEWNSTIIKKPSTFIVVVAGLFVILYLPIFSALVKMWWGSDDYNHGFLVPIVSLYFVWMKRDQLRLAPIRPSYLGGLPVIILSSALLLMGKLGSATLLQELSLPVMIAGLLLLLAGAGWLKLLALPIGYLLFMIKLFGEGDDRFHWPFQLIAANIGVWLLHLMGFPAYQHDQFIELPRVTLEVASACSGVRFLMSIIAIGIPLAILTQSTWPRRICLVLFGVLIAILANGFRVALIGIWTYYHGTNGDVHGPLHILQGVFVSWIGFIALFAGAWCLGRNRGEWGHPRHADDNAMTPSAKQQLTDEEHGVVRFRSWTLAIALLLVTGSVYYGVRPAPVPLQHDLDSLPLTIGSWSGYAVNLEQEPLRVPGADQELLRLYRNPSGRILTLYIAYFNFQEQGRKLVGYQTLERFHQGETVVTLPAGSERSYKLNQAVLRVGQGKRFVLFWYDLNGRMAAGSYEAKLRTLWNALTLGRLNGALVAVSAPVTQKDSLERLSSDGRQFVENLLPILHLYLPGAAR